MMRKYPTTVALLALVALPAGLAALQERENPGFAVAAGRATFQRYCASCHGPEAKGDGNVAQFLEVPPADLTQLTATYGEFPAEQVRRFIDGREEARAHGTREMPVWGEVFQSSMAEPRRPEDRGDERAAGIIDQLVAFIESIQTTP
jgi:mono/diheme cytochrome c family protein